jgi:NDP-sugar pyrophosphorylase family protein
MDHSMMTSPAQEILRSAGRPVRALVLAAGEGTRLRPLTLERPKPMLPIAGTPLLERIVRQLVAAGIADIAINLHYKPETITAHFGSGVAFGARVHYAHEKTLLGSAGAARNVLDWAGAGPLLLYYGDLLSNLDPARLIQAHDQNRARFPDLAATLCLYRVDNPTEVGLVGMDADGRITKFVEKPKREDVFTDVANAALCVIETTQLAELMPGRVFDFGLHVFPDWLARGLPLCGWMLPDDAYLLDIGSPDKYDQANREWPQLQH